tara:strand:+ start:592 stop:1173 length:582 start_codon:yes stop_codon:yes gene_type:complete
MANSTKKSTSILRDLRNLIIWVFIAVTIRWQIIEPRWIPSGSMLPTLQIQDKILVDKFSVKFNPKVNYPKLKNKIIVFNAPDNLINAGYNSNTALIKRVIGIPGDKIEIKEGSLFLNDQLQKNTSADSGINYSTKPFIVPKETFWVMGDNRNNSMDSHVWGALPYKKVIGKAIFRYWPLDNMGPIKFPNINKI